MIIIKKWFAILLVLGFFAPTAVFAQDDDEEYEEEEEEEAPPKKASKKKAVKEKAVPDGPSRVGMYVAFGGYSDAIGFVYDFGTGFQLGCGIGYNRRAWTPVGGEEQSAQTWSIRPVMTYSLGKGLFGYGLGLRASITGSDDLNPDGVTNMSVTPNFYVSAALIPNLVLSLSGGLQVDKLGEYGGNESQLNLSTVASVLMIFYFL